MRRVILKNCKQCRKELNGSGRGRPVYCSDSCRAKGTAARVRFWNLEKKYGMDKSVFDKMKSDQKFKCYLCEKNEKDCHNGLYVDHDHKTGKVRKLLCRDCNAGIGLLMENPKLLIKAAEYLIFSKE